MITSHFGQLLLTKEARDGQRYEIREIARATSLSPTTINAWKQGRVNRFDSRTVSALCAWLPCTMEELLSHEQTEAGRRLA